MTQVKAEMDRLPKSTIEDYLIGLPTRVHDDLYSNPSSCLAIFRLLPSMAKMFVMFLLYSPPGYTPKVMFEKLVQQKFKTEQLRSIDLLTKLNIFTQNKQGFSLHDNFQKQFRYALENNSNPLYFGDLLYAQNDEQNEDNNAIPNLQFLEKFATSQFENVSKFLVGNSGLNSVTRHEDSKSRPNKSIMKILLRAELVSQQHQITQAGFQFLLLDTKSQVWLILLQWLEMAKESNLEPVEGLYFIFMLGSLSVGCGYSTKFLSEAQKSLLSDLHEIGLVYNTITTISSSTNNKAENASVFFPTSLSRHIIYDTLHDVQTSESQHLANLPVTQPDHDEFLIVETNYSLYAYTSSDLHISVLNLFFNLKSRFPNLVTGKLTRDSVRRALIQGITAEQIISYLESHAHPIMRQKTPHLPSTVLDQIRLWEIERERIQTTEAYLLKDFASFKEFESVLEYCKNTNILLHSVPKKRSLVVSVTGLKLVQEFMRSSSSSSSSSSSKTN